MCTRAPAIEAMLWQNVNRRWKIWMREKENNTKIWSDFIHVLLVNLIHTFCATHSYRSYFVSHSLLVYFLLLKSARARSRLFVCQFEQNFSNITPYFSHWHTHTQRNCQYRVHWYKRRRRQYQWFHLTFNSTLFQWRKYPNYAIQV